MHYKEQGGNHSRSGFRSLRSLHPGLHAATCYAGSLTFCFLLLLGAGCSARHSANEKHYDLKGKVVAVDKAGRTATIAHEEIKGYMPAMTMQYRFAPKDEKWALDVLMPGDQISATLVVSDESSTLEDPVITSEAVVDQNAQTVDGLSEPRPGDEVPDFGLVNQDGKRIHLADYHGKTLLVTFIYTRCPLPEYCTLMSNNFHEIDQELAKNPEQYSKTHLLTVSFDSDYDTPRVLRSYGAAHTGRYADETFEHWEFASGTPDEVKGMAQFFGLRFYHDTQSGQDQIIHTLRTAIIGPDGKLVRLYRDNRWKPAEILAELQAHRSVSDPILP